MRWGRRRFWRQPGAAEHGAVPTGGMCGCGVGLRPGAAGAFGRAQSGACFRPVRVWWTLLAGALWRPCGAAEHGAVPTGGDVRVRYWLAAGCGRGFWSGTVWRVLSAGAGVVDAFGWRVVAAVRCGARVQRRARWLAFLLREKMLDKLCKSILNWKQGITLAAAGDGLRHRPHRRSCSVYPTSTSSVAAWPPRHLPRTAKGDARSHPRRALPPRAPPRVCASHVYLIRRGVAAAPPSPHRQRRCTISSEAGLAPSDSPAGVRIPRPPHPSRRLRSCAARSTRAFPALPSAKRRRKTPPRIEPMLGGVL